VEIGQLGNIVLLGYFPCPSANLPQFWQARWIVVVGADFNFKDIGYLGAAEGSVKVQPTTALTSSDPPQTRVPFLNFLNVVIEFNEA
jgi:hypothetical protein